MYVCMYVYIYIHKLSVSMSHNLLFAKHGGNGSTMVTMLLGNTALGPVLRASLNQLAGFDC